MIVTIFTRRKVSSYVQAGIPSWEKIISEFYSFKTGVVGLSHINK